MKSNCRRKKKHKKTRRKHKKYFKLMGGSDEDFVRLCIIGDLNQIKQYLQEHPDTNISVNYDEPFRMACERGHLDVAQWLLELQGDELSYYAITEAFKGTCHSGNLPIAQWLFQLSKERGQEINLSDENHYYFRTVCKNGYMDLATWLMELKPEYEISEKNGKLFCKILTQKNKEKKEKWNRRKSIVYLGSEMSGNKNMYKMPNDVLRIVGSYL